jgi:cardiolipin synthase
LGTLAVSVPVTQLAKWKTAMQMVAIGFLLAGSAGDKIFPLTTMTGITLLWISALLTLFTGYDYLLAALRHAMTDED